ncbi:hypothetical protein [Brevundimonas naejangsanensis]
MSFLRDALFPLTVALLAVLVVLFVSTVSMACEARTDQGMMSMAINCDDGPYEQKAVKISCQKACLVFFQGLLPQAGGPAPARIYASVSYPALNARVADFTLEADEPPPRI